MIARHSYQRCIHGLATVNAVNMRLQPVLLRRITKVAAQLSTDLAQESRAKAPLTCQRHVTSRIPIIDISALFRNDTCGSVAAARALSDAFADCGFAVVVGNGVSSHRVEALRGAGFRFFGQELQDKLAVNQGAVGYGNAPYAHMQENGAQLLGDFSKPTDIVESLTYRGLESSSVKATLPTTPPGFKEAVVEFHNDVADLRCKLVAAVELAFGLRDGFIAEKCVGATESLRLAHYPDPGEQLLPGQMRYGAHVDSYGLTVLNLDPDAPDGLQVQVDGVRCQRS